MRFSKGREGVGLLIGVATFLSAFLPNSMFLLFLCLLAFGMARELGKALGASEVSYLAPLVLVLSVFSFELGIAGVLLLAFLFAYLRWSLDCLLKAVFVLIYAGFLPIYLYMVKSQSSWELIKLVFFAYTVDTASYYAGKLFGKRPLAVRLSPKKTWEGLAGGMLGGMLFFYFINKPVLLAVPFVLIALAGDLFKSFIKRQVGIKDFSNLLGEHGGLVDRFDSVLFVAIFWKFL
ncbi:phosphatidate cytidylyltransferase [Thermocrinis ruber]|nr:phosphatidate cytidylyltransferase [Thermocrinis ruber]